MSFVRFRRTTLMTSALTFALIAVSLVAAHGTETALQARIAEPHGTGPRARGSGTFMEYPVPTPQSMLIGITTGPDGALWFTEYNGNNIGRVTTTGQVTEYPVPSKGNPYEITAGPDGALWFTEHNSAIGRITTNGAVSEFPTPGGPTYGIVTGPDGALWYGDSATNSIGRMTTQGVVTEYRLPTAGSEPYDIVVGPDGALWFTELVASKIGRITTNGTITEYRTPTHESQPNGITADPNNQLWFVEWAANKIAYVSTQGQFSELSLKRGKHPIRITYGSGATVWFSEQFGNYIGAITSGSLTRYRIPTKKSQPFEITIGP